ncbi:hypothetical protein Pmani_020682 [Petrolisthes manimaculis]|uniref:Uncharacterized protein n=1 Tax=Petrolisthes manimaculis TaxID=1843537 RepID=A0AAE1U622_9EUCA|nr:hypothetical protein Pmani_020682 [Petrolisthes manimaculis]
MRKTVAAMVGDESTDTVHLAAFLTIAKKLLLDRRFPGHSKDELSRALGVLGKEGRSYLSEFHPQSDTSKTPGMYGETKKTVFRPAGTLSREDLARLLTVEGEALRADEAEELLLSVPMRDSDLVDLDQYAVQLVPPPRIF